MERRITMSGDPALTLLLTSVAARHVFAAVAKRRLISFKDLIRVITVATEDWEEINKSLEVLKQADLIKEETAPVKDFSNFYVTANGLRAERQLQRMPGMDLESTIG
jgi:hypothetical protein